MRRFLYAAALFVIGLSACVHRSPNERVLAAFSGDKSGPLFLGEPAPEYLGYADPVSARVLGAAFRDGEYRTPPPGQPLYCPGAAVSGNKGYVLSVHVNQAMGDTAFATLTEDCAQSGTCPSGQSCASVGTVRHMTNYLLVRTNRQWRIVKPVSSTVVIGT
jgi:hypothetical protein